MARSIRRKRNNRGLRKEADEEDDEDEDDNDDDGAAKKSKRIRRNKSLINAERLDARRKKRKKKQMQKTTAVTTKPKTKGWVNAKSTSISVASNHNTSTSKQKSISANGQKDKTTTTKPKRSNGIDLPYQSTIQALQLYYSKHGNLVMPRRYSVPEGEGYPQEWHGVDLAATVYDMKWWTQHVKQKPDRVTELNRMGFLWERLQPEWNLVLEALIYYSSIHNDVLVPGKFVVPHGDSRWPPATWGIPLGNCVYRIRNRNDFLRGPSAESRRDQLDGLGFVWNVQEHRFQIFYNALEHFARLEGGGGRGGGGAAATTDASISISGRNTALRVPATFVIPSNTSEWPHELWGYPLGAKCTAIRQKQLYVKNHPHRQKLLEGLRFQWRSGNASLGWLEVMHAAAIYSKIHHRKLDVPYKFKVPAPPTNLDPKMRIDVSTAGDQDDDVWPWPEHLWGLPLGARLKDVRQKGAYLKGKNGDTRRRQLDALGFVWTPKRGRPSNSVA